MAAQYGGEYKAYDQIDSAPEEKARGITIATAHVEYQSPQRHYATSTVRDMRLHQEHDHRCGANGRRGAGGVGGGRTDAADPRAHPAGAAVGVPYIVVYMNKADMVDDPELLELVEMEVRELLSLYDFPGTTSDCDRLGAEGPRRDKSELGEPSVIKLVDAMDAYIPVPQRKWTNRF